MDDGPPRRLGHRRARHHQKPGPQDAGQRCGATAGSPRPGPPAGGHMMGGQLCTQVVALSMLGHLVTLTQSARVVLFAMATIARDMPQNHTDPVTYWGGWELLAKALGHKEPTPTAKRAVARAVAELVDAGLVEP